MKLPKEFKEREIKSDLSPFKVHLVALHSLGLLDDEVYLKVDYYNHIDPTDNIWQGEVVKQQYGETVFIPVTSFDGYYIILTENLTKKGKNSLCELKSYRDLNLSDPYLKKMRGFCLDHVVIDDLTTLGLKQYLNACVAREHFDLAAKVKNYCVEQNINFNE